MRNAGQNTAGKSLTTKPIELHVHAADHRPWRAARNAQKAAATAKMSKRPASTITEPRAR